MSKLYFRYGTVASAKTLNLLAVAHNYRQQGKRVALLRPKMDVRFGVAVISSRAGLSEEADLLVDDSTDLPRSSWRGSLSCILVDEAQFLGPRMIEQLRAVAWEDDIPVICYGLRADFRAELFPGSKRLFELADSIEEIKTTCAFCNRKATMNLKHLNGVATDQGPSIELGADEKYLPACYRCFSLQLRAARLEQVPLKVVG